MEADRTITHANRLVRDSDLSAAPCGADGPMAAPGDKYTCPECRAFYAALKKRLLVIGYFDGGADGE